MPHFATNIIKFGLPYKDWTLIESNLASLKLRFNEDICGYCDSNKREIYIALDDINTPEFILLHELIHALDELAVEYDGENKIDHKAQLLLNFLLLNKQLINQLSTGTE